MARPAGCWFRRSPMPNWPAIWPTSGKLGAIPADLAGDLLMAIHRHDDGWADWDAGRESTRNRAGRSSSTKCGWPIRLAIWTRSIDLAACRGPIDGIFCGRSFHSPAAAIRFLAQATRREDLAREFLQRQQLSMAGWQAVWQFERDASTAVGSCQQGADAADRGVAYLQLFDADQPLVLLCRAARAAADRADGQQGLDVFAHRQRARLSAGADRALAVSGRIVRAGGQRPGCAASALSLDRRNAGRRGSRSDAASLAQYDDYRRRGQMLREVR